VCVESDLASAYVLRPYVTIFLNISEYRSLGWRRTRTRASGEIQYLNWGISPQLAGLKYIMWSTKRGTYSEGDQAQRGIRDGVNGCPKGLLIRSQISGSGCLAQGNLRDGRGWGSGPMIRDNQDSS
jgi:hypothetical protein